MGQSCPDCNAERGRGKKGLARFCGECGHQFADDDEGGQSTAKLTGRSSSAEQPVMYSPMNRATGGAGEPEAHIQSEPIATNSATTSRSKENVSVSPHPLEPPYKLSKLKISPDDRAEPDTASDEEQLNETTQMSIVTPNTYIDNIQTIDNSQALVQRLLQTTENSSHAQDDPQATPPLDQRPELLIIQQPTNQERFAKEYKPRELSKSSYVEEEYDYLPTQSFRDIWYHPPIKRYNSLPTLLPSFTMENVQTEQTVDDKADDWDSDDEEWFKSDAVETTPAESMDTTDTTTKATADDAQSEPMEEDEEVKDDSSKITAASDASAAAEVTTVQQAPVSDKGSLSDVLEVFKKYKENIDKLCEPTCKETLSAADIKKISSYSKDCTNKFAAYNQLSKKSQTKKDDKAGKDEKAPSKHQQECLNGMEKFINKNSVQLNKIFEAYGLKPVEITSVSQKPTRTHRKMTFMVVLSTPFTHFFKSRGVEEPVVEIRRYSDTTKWTESLTTLYKRDQDVWIGEWSAPISMPTSTMEYMYIVHDGVRITKDGREWLHKRSKKKCRTLDIGGQERISTKSRHFNGVGKMLDQDPVLKKTKASSL